MGKIAKFVDLTGQKFGKLVITGIQKDSPNRKSRAWKAQCNCGRMPDFTVDEYCLLSGKIYQCTKCRYDKMLASQIKCNNYSLSGKYGIGYASNTSEKFYFDLEDYDKIKGFTWRINNYGYIVTSINRKQIYLHRVVMGLPAGVDKSNPLIIDHINKNKIDNRKNNLRICTTKENNLNSNMYHTNKSGVIGVMWENDRKRWKASLIKGRAQILCERYSNKEDAIKARLAAELKYFGDFAPQRHLFEQYGIKEIED